MAGYTAFLSSIYWLDSGFTNFLAILYSNNIICNFYKFIAYCTLNISYFCRIINIFCEFYIKTLDYQSFLQIEIGANIRT